MRVNDVLTADIVERLNLPTSQAICLPNAAYTDAGYLDTECQTLFAADWAFAGVGAQIPKRGDVVPVMVANHPILLVRNKTGEVKAFHNVCRHRGLQLVANAQSGRAALMCPYHAWTYSLDGELKKTPHFGGHDCDQAPDFNKDDYGLKPVRVELWNDLIFVNIDGQAAPLVKTLGPLAERWVGYDFSQLRHGGSATFEANCNWKLAIENFVESYHLPWTHPGLNRYSLMQAHYNMIEPTYVGQGSSNYISADAGHPDLPLFPNLPAERQTVAEYPCLLPNLMLGIHPSYFFVFAVQPIAPDRTLELFHFYFAGDAAMTDELAGQRAQVMENWKSINREDITMIEGMQQGRRSPGYQNGRFSPYHEITTHTFQQRVAARLLGQ